MSFSEALQMLFWILVVSGTVFYFTKSVKRLLQVAGGLAALSLWNNIWDIGVWPVIQGLFGMYGILGLTVVALILNFSLLWWYHNHCVTDWLGIGIGDDVVEKSLHLQGKFAHSEGIKRLMLLVPVYGYLLAAKVIKGKWVPFLALSLFVDSFMAMAFILHGRKQNGCKAMKRSDYVLFFLSTVLGCVAWSVFTEFVTLPAFRNLWDTISS